MNSNFDLKKKYIPLVANGQLSTRQCAAKIGISHVRVSQIAKRYKTEGDAAFIHKLKGRPSNNLSISPVTERKIIELYKSEFNGANFGAFWSFLRDFEHMDISYHVLYNFMLRHGFKTPKAHKKERKLHKPRPEREREGELIQFDASPYDWAMTGEKWNLHGAIDDATHTFTGLYFESNECRLGYNEVLRQTFEKHGIMMDSYTDLGSSFFANRRKKPDETDEELRLSKKTSNTNWVQVCKDLKIRSIIALSPQAKGRIERAWQTLQGRLPWILRHFRIDNIVDANNFLSSTYIDLYNQEFRREPKNPVSAYRRLPKNYDLDYALAVKKNCRTDQYGCFVYHDCDFHLIANNAAYKHITFVLSEKIGVCARMNGKYYPVELASPMMDVYGDNMPVVEKELIQKFLLDSTKSQFRTA